MTVIRADDVSQLPDNFIACRDRGHAWYDPRDGDRDMHVEKDGRYYDRRLHCPRCGTYRRDLLNIQGMQMVSPKYEYPDGYLLRRGARTTRREVRSIALRAAISVIKSRKKKGA